MPVNFCSSLPTTADGSLDHSALNPAIQGLTQLIWATGRHKFRQQNSQHCNTSTLYSYRCCQDEAWDRSAGQATLRDRQKIKRYSCESKLTLKVSLTNCSLDLTLQHSYHDVYVDISLPLVVQSFVLDRAARQTPSEIYRALYGSHEIGHVKQHQVYYLWQQANAKMWRRNPDEFLSAHALVAEKPREYQRKEIKVGNLRGLAIYISESISSLSSCKELAMDATYGTNHSGSDLFAVLAELDGTGIPVAYLFVNTLPLSQEACVSPNPADPGAKSQTLLQFLRPLQTAGFQPTFFGSDKDHSQINAIKTVWPGASIQLCFWHAKRAVKTKLRSSQRTSSQNGYSPGKVRKVMGSRSFIDYRFL